MALLAMALLLAGTRSHGQADEESRPATMSLIAPLASRSLLLDISASGPFVVAVGERGHILVSDDGGESWVQSSVPTRNTLCAVAMVDPEHIWVAGHDAVILHSSDRGRTWEVQHELPQEDMPLFALWFENERRGIAIGAYGLILETQDGGARWEQRTLDEIDRHLYGMTETVDGELFIAGETGTILRSRDRGDSWSILESPYTGSFFGVLALQQGGVLVYGLRGHVYHSVDGGETWQPLPMPGAATFLSGLQLLDGTILLFGLSGSVYVADPGGLEFHDRSRKDRVALADGVPVAGDRVLLVGENGIQWLDAEREPGETTP